MLNALLQGRHETRSLHLLVQNALWKPWKAVQRNSKTDHDDGRTEDVC